jgi:hypothetical protein
MRGTAAECKCERLPNANGTPAILAQGAAMIRSSSAATRQAVGILD